MVVFFLTLVFLTNYLETFCCEPLSDFRQPGHLWLNMTKFSVSLSEMS
jgi:hypothetical protein